MAENTTNSVLTIGDGIAAWCLNFYLSQQGISHDHFAQESFFPACSLNSTAINCLRGTEKGLSPLGDLIVESYQDFLSFNESFKPDGITEGLEYQFFNDKSKFEKRHPEFEAIKKDDFIKDFKFCAQEKAYLVNPPLLKSWFKQKNDHTSFYSYWVKELLCENHQIKVVTDSGEYLYDKVFLCGGDMVRSLGKGFSNSFDTYLEYSKPVTGTYLEIEIGEEYGTEDRSYALDKFHLVIKPSQKTMLLGSTSEQGAFKHPSSEIRDIFYFVQKHFELELPSFEKWELKMGIRNKGRKRTPFWGEIAPHLFVVSGLYKNGYTYAFKAARDLLISQRTPF